MTPDDERDYANLLHAKHPRVIRTEAEKDAMLRDVESLLIKGDDMSPAEFELLQLLTTLIERFEEEHYASPPVLPRVSHQKH